MCVGLYKLLSFSYVKQTPSSYLTILIVLYFKVSVSYILYFVWSYQRRNWQAQTSAERGLRRGLHHVTLPNS